MRAPYYLHKVLVQGLTLLYHIFLNGMEKVFKHCRILLIPSLCLSLPLRQAAYTCTINLFVMHQWCSPVRNMLHPREKLDPVSTWRSGASNMICKILDNSQDVISFQCNWREAVYNRHNCKVGIRVGLGIGHFPSSPTCPTPHLKPPTPQGRAHALLPSSFWNANHLLVVMDTL